jgi:16S rRNA (uracil1498-N3)-methyltransferase
MSWKEMLDYMGKLDYNIILYENAFGMAGTKKCIKTAVQKKHVGILVGPEGGFEENEVAQAVECGAECVSLGHRILRTETAGLAMLSMLVYVLEV